MWATSLPHATFFTYTIFCIGRELFYFSTRLIPPSGDTYHRKTAESEKQKVFTLYGKAFPFGESGARRRERFPLFRFKNRGGTSCRVNKKMNPTNCRIHFLSVDISTFFYLIYQDNLFDYALFFTKRRTTQATSPTISIPKITDIVTRALLSF